MSVGSPPEPAPAGRNSVGRFVELLIHVICVVILIRVVLIFLGANIDQPLVGAIVTFTQPFAAPFEGIIAQPTDQSGIVPIDVGAVIGIGALQLVRLFVHAVGRRVAELP